MTHISEQLMEKLSDEKAMPRMATKDGQGRLLADRPDLAQLKSESILNSIVATERDTCMVALARQALLLVQGESCGQCVFCREGTIQLIEILTDIMEGRGGSADMDLLWELGETMKLGASCLLGWMAPEAVLLTVRQFRSDYEAHIKERRCPTGTCKMPGRN